MAPRAPTRLQPAAAALALLAALLLSPCASAFKCPIKRGTHRAVGCQSIVMPPNLCTSCRMRPVPRDGNFKNPRDIYELDTDECRAGIQSYVDQNPCDWRRKAQLKRFWMRGNRLALADFMYSICETCCDCIPWTSRPWTYEKQKSENTLIKVTRGNCPAHAWYDICVFWPQVRQVRPPGAKEDLSAPKVCPLLCKWFHSPQRKNWLYNPFIAGLDPNIKTFLWQVLWWGQCKNKVVWQECARMELAQRRI